MREALFLGDSHSGVLRKGCNARGWRVHGGMLQTGSKLEGDILTVEDGEVRFTSSKLQGRYERALAPIGVKSAHRANMPIISTLGFNTHRFMRDMDGYTLDPAETGKMFLSRQVFEAIVARARVSALAFYRALRDAPIIAVHSPQRTSTSTTKMAIEGDDLFGGWLRDMGVEVIDLRPQTVDENNRLRPEFWTEDPRDRAHANRAYTDLVVDELERRLDAREQIAQAAE